MKIAFVANTSWNIYNFRKGLVHAFLSQGHEVLMITPEDEYAARVVEWGVNWIDTPLDGTGINPVQDLKYLTRLKKIFRQEKPDVVLGYTIKSNIYACLASDARTPVICNVSGLGTVFLVEGAVGKVAMQLYKLAFRKAAFVFFQNEDDKRLFLSKVRVDQEKIGLLPGSGIDLDAFPYTPATYSKPVKLLMISRLIIEKGVQEFAEAAASFDTGEVHFTLVGKFDENHSRSISKADLEEWVGNKWITYFPHSDNIKQLITDHEVVVLPSYREGTPRTLLESASMGRALLTTDAPGCKEVVDDGVNGFLFKVKSSKSLVDKINLYLSLSVEERKKMSEASRALVERKFDEKHVIDAYSQAIEEITSLT